MQNSIARHLSQEGQSQNIPLDQNIYNNNYCGGKELKESRSPSTEDWLNKLYMNVMEFYSAITNNEYEEFTKAWLEIDG